MLKQNNIIIVKISIAYNDSYRELCKSTAIKESELHLKIIKGLDSINFLNDWTQEVGKTIQDLVDEYQEHTIDEIVVSIFPFSQHIESDEVKSFISGIRFWGTGTGTICPSCGSECDGEEDGADGHVWMDWTCVNPECDFKYSGEPDWDVLPGGYDTKH